MDYCKIEYFTDKILSRSESQGVKTLFRANSCYIPLDSKFNGDKTLTKESRMTM